MSEFPDNNTITLVPIENLVFDPDNPRLPSTKTGAKEEDIFKYMLDKSNLIDVMLSIATQGYFIGEPLLVTPSGSEGQFEVLEGNRRLAALKLLKNPALAPVKKESVRKVVEEAEFIPDEVPVLIYKSRKEVLLYLGYRHITGVDEWDSLAKAKYLTQLKETFSGENYLTVLKKLAKIIGSKSDYVHKLLAGYQVYQEIEKNGFFDISDLDEEEFPFSLLTTALSYKNISTYIGVDTEKTETIENIDIDNLKDLSEWMFKENSEGVTRLGESRNLKTLSAVVAEPRALKVFKDQNRSLEESRAFTDEPKQFFSEAIRQSLTKLMDARNAFHNVQNPTDGDLANLKDIQAITKDLAALVRIKIEAEESE